MSLTFLSISSLPRAADAALRGSSPQLTVRCRHNLSIFTSSGLRAMTRGPIGGCMVSLYPSPFDSQVPKG